MWGGEGGGHFYFLLMDVINVPACLLPVSILQRYHPACGH